MVQTRKAQALKKSPRTRTRKYRDWPVDSDRYHPSLYGAQARPHGERGTRLQGQFQRLHSWDMSSAQAQARPVWLAGAIIKAAAWKADTRPGQDSSLHPACLHCQLAVEEGETRIAGVAPGPP